MKKKERIPVKVWSPNERDMEIVERLEYKTGLNHSNLVRLAIYHFAEFHGVRDGATPRKNLHEKGVRA